MQPRASMWFVNTKMVADFNANSLEPENKAIRLSAFARYFCPSARHFIHIAALDPGVKWGPGRMRTELWLSWHVRAYKTATGRNAPQGVEKVHFECRIVSESYDRGNIIHCEALWS